MFKREFSLKNKYNFSNIFKNGESHSSNHLILRRLPNLEGQKSIGIVVSSKFSKSSVIRNQIKRLIAEPVRVNITSMPAGKYVFIPKKNILNENGKISVNVEILSSEINTLLSKMALS